MGRITADPVLHGSTFWFVFLGGVAAGSYALACLANVLGNEADRRATRPAFFLAFPLVAVCGGLLCPAGSRAFAVGSLAAFLVLSAGSLLTVIGEDFGLARASTSLVGRAFATAGALAAIAFAATTGLVYRPGWAGPAWLAAVSLASAATSGVSAVVLLNGWRNPEGGGDAVERLGRINALAVLAELATLAGLAVSLRGPSGIAFVTWPGMLIPLFVVPVGLVLPLIVGEAKGARGEVDASLLVLLGGFVLRAAVTGIHSSVPYR